MADVLGPICTKGKSYRARAEALQREYRASIGVPHGSYGHFLAQEAADAGRNFVLPESFQAARVRQSAGKGVAPRTFENMLSSQAMAFNLFAPLGTRLDLADEVLRPFVPGLANVKSRHRRGSGEAARPARGDEPRLALRGGGAVSTPRSTAMTMTVSQGESRYGRPEPQIALRFPKGTSTAS